MFTKKKAISLFLCLVMLAAFVPAAITASGTDYEVEKSGGPSDFFEWLNIDGQTVSNCTEEMVGVGRGWHVSGSTIYLNGYNGGGIVASIYDKHYGNQVQIVVTTDSKIRDGVYGIYSDYGVAISAEHATLDIEAGYCGICCNGLLSITGGRVNIKCIDNGWANIAIHQTHWLIEPFMLTEDSELFIDWKATTSKDIYGMYGIWNIVGSDAVEGSHGKVGKMSVSVENYGEGRAYVHEVDDQLDKVINDLKKRETVYDSDDKHFFLNMVGIDRLDLKVTEPEAGENPSSAVTVAQPYVTATVTGWEEKSTYLVFI